MFTGIITHIGTIISRREEGDLCVRITSDINSDTLKIGESIACNGVCLTVITKGMDGKTSWFDASVSAETLRITAPSGWLQDATLNLERSLKMGDDLSGHIVSGHVDDVATLTKIVEEGDSHRLSFEVAAPLHRFISKKGSVTLNGVSLTVNAVEQRMFEVNIIPHTWKHTNFHLLKSGSQVNIEVDTLARMMARLIETENDPT